MTPRRTYRIAFFALGWLIALGILFQFGFKSVFVKVYAGIADGLSRVQQAVSDAEGRALTRARHTSRSDYLQPLAPTLRSADALRAPTGMLFGAYDGLLPRSFAGFEKFEEGLDFRFPIVSFYVAWGDKPEQQFPARMVETIDRMGSVPMVTWEPWVVDFDTSRRTNLPPRAEREYASLAAIARGEYDFYVVPWAAAAARYGKPMFLRFAHEMNDPYRYPWGPQNGNRPEDFIAAWKHVHQVFQKMSAANVLWVWSPHISMPWFEYYYPGPEWVDWVGFGVLNYGSVATWSRWWSFHQIVEKSYPALLALKKPLVICEFGTLSYGGDILEWYKQAFYHLDHTYGRVQAVVFFNQSQDTTMSAYPLDWSVLAERRATAFVAGELARKSVLER
ncbi:MAG: glycoside hydrolase family 26 protein [Thermoanaerobaculia bacterium]